MGLPAPRGPLSQDLFAVLRGRPGPAALALGELVGTVDAAANLGDGGDARTCEDTQIALFACYGLHYDGFEDVDAGWEWNPHLLAVRTTLEARFERDLLTSAGEAAPQLSGGAPLARFLLDAASPAHESALGTYVHRQATLEQFRELVIHRSIYNLREGDQHTWAIPRIGGRAKSALVAIQADEYGGGVPGRMHAELFGYTMRELDLDPTYGAYVERIPAISIAILNLMSLFGLHRRWRGALLGNLAVTEIGSSIANRRYSEGLARLGASDRARWFYDEHIEADAVHEQLAAHDMCGSFAAEHPEELNTVILGAQATLDLRRLFATTVTDAWNRGTTSLRAGTPA
jgi:heme oxygenase-like protein